MNKKQKSLVLLPYYFLLVIPLLIGCAEKSPSPLLSDKTKDRKELRVGTTGDYAPFSFYKNKTFQGIDIDLAQALAKEFGMPLTLVKTSWPTLSQDLIDQKFDLAISGITIKDERKEVGLFSKPYYQFGKLPIARCKDKLKYNSLKKIDQPSTRVIVNPGGTNYEFTVKNIKSAKIKVFPENSKIFNEITNNRADIMITDSVEVYYQAKVSKGKLCPTMKTALTSSEMGIFMPKDENLKLRIDDWLEKYKSSGKLKKLFSQWL